MLNDLLLLSGIDIPFSAASVNIHQPTLKEIAYIGEETFFVGCELLNFSKERLTTEDKARLNNQSDFDIIMSIMKDKNNPSARKSAVAARMVLVLIFPDYTVQIREDKIALLKTYSLNIIKDGKPAKEQRTDELFINNGNYSDFQRILKEMFCLKHNKKDEQSYNPQGDMAKKIAEKLMKGRQRVAAIKGQQTDKIAVFSRYASILAVGESKDLNQLMQYTVYQLFDEFNRFELKESNDIYVQAKMAGAKDLKEIDSWMKDIHSDSIDN